MRPVFWMPSSKGGTWISYSKPEGLIHFLQSQRDQGVSVAAASTPVFQSPVPLPRSPAHMARSTVTPQHPVAAVIRGKAGTGTRPSRLGTRRPATSRLARPSTAQPKGRGTRTPHTVVVPEARGTRGTVGTRGSSRVGTAPTRPGMSPIHESATPTHIPPSPTPLPYTPISASHGVPPEEREREMEREVEVETPSTSTSSCGMQTPTQRVPNRGMRRPQTAAARGRPSAIGTIGTTGTKRRTLTPRGPPTTGRRGVERETSGSGSGRTVYIPHGVDTSKLVRAALARSVLAGGALAGRLASALAAIEEGGKGLYLIVLIDSKTAGYSGLIRVRSDGSLHAVDGVKGLTVSLSLSLSLSLHTHIHTYIYVSPQSPCRGWCQGPARLCQPGCH
ncbi:hypothetical protein KIPB_001849 [Kipferlia bialata]|uniref:Uncharacterized protein n=1 Tax=Kipferlia bialata TaxID=797122 RepID=A0A9K3CRD3_9EUKA|nr:hypothetical protein KIPB_001849 [Kipferlia bialata]|eukprot:g1849.t1